EQRNAERAAMGKPPIDEDEAEPATLDGPAEPQTAPEEPAAEGSYQPDIDADAEPDPDAVQREQDREDYLAFMKDRFAECRTREELDGAWSGCAAHLPQLGIEEASAWHNRFLSAYGVRQKQIPGGRR
ncbi:MAG: hypothetical protein MI824_15110, partial [Hyphomicrobiales bacterium]|nr:hypothetical protein [Hyphomicrobiales bacterium]